MSSIRNILKLIFPYWGTLIILLIGIRTTEYVSYLSPAKSMNYKSSYFYLGLLMDLFLANIVVAIGFLITYILFKLSKKTSLFLFHFIMVLLCFSTIALSVYFLLTGNALDRTFFAQRFSDILIVIDFKTYIDYKLILGLAVVFSFYFGVGKWLRNVTINDQKLTIFGVVLLVSLFASPFSVVRDKSKFQKTVFLNNRFSYFVSEGFQYYWASFYPKKLKTIQVKSFAKLDPVFFGTIAINKEHPAYHELKTDPSFRNSFYLNPKVPPNIVIIIVESLSTDFVGKYAHRTGKLMPFLDSLSTKSLYFPNVLSTCERTYNVLPAICGSLPNSGLEPATMMLKEQPAFTSLQDNLSSTHFSRFYCGVFMQFTNMDQFMASAGTNYLIKEWDPKFKKSPHSSYADADLLEQTLLDLPQIPKDKQRLDIILTFDTHAPYVYPNKQDHKQIVLKKADGEGIENKEIIKKWSAELGAFIYTDISLKTYFDRVSKLPEHQNTIYFITGDHSSELTLFTPISRFRVPLIVTSPLLKKAKQIDAVSTHLDIAPSIFSLLAPYNLLRSTKSTSIGQGLDMQANYRCNRSLPFMSFSYANNWLLYKNTFLFQNNVFKVGKDLEVTEFKDSKKTKELQNQLRRYNAFSQYSLTQNQLMPWLDGFAFKNVRDFDTLGFFANSAINKALVKKDLIYVGKSVWFKTDKKLLILKTEITYNLHRKRDYRKLPKMAIQLLSKDGKPVSFLNASPQFISKTGNLYKVAYEYVIQTQEKFSKHKTGKMTYYLFDSKLRNLPLVKYETRVLQR
jgi:lipoteichoic acid synthase